MTSSAPTCAYLSPFMFDCPRCEGKGGDCALCNGRGTFTTEAKTGGHPRNLAQFYHVDPECALKKLRRMVKSKDPHVRHAAARFAYLNRLEEFRTYWKHEGYGGNE